ncbi:MAG: hypothetical protein KZQ89_10625 [Candidatus Thiodiazotropha sp. (ex Lucinoma kastoroae)]|nr:hypothetical protein [Candidatus Thiodiazotropha sp. (ex Lucinoma kastoroae)]
MARLAIIENGAVTNVIVSVTGIYPGSVDVTDEPQVGPGWLFDGLVFSAPNHPAGDPVVMPSVWSVLEFKRKFTQSERMHIRMAREASAMIDDLFDLVDSAQVIMSDDAGLMAGLQYMESEGLLATGRAAEILGNHSDAR